MTDSNSLLQLEFLYIKNFEGPGKVKKEDYLPIINWLLFAGTVEGSANKLILLILAVEYILASLHNQINN